MSQMSEQKNNQNSKEPIINVLHNKSADDLINSLKEYLPAEFQKSILESVVVAYENSAQKEVGSVTILSVDPDTGNIKQVNELNQDISVGKKEL